MSSDLKFAVPQTSVPTNIHIPAFKGDLENFVKKVLLINGHNQRWEDLKFEKRMNGGKEGEKRAGVMIWYQTIEQFSYTLYSIIW